MLRPRELFRKATLGLITLILVIAYPLTAWADDPSGRGPDAPQGPDANTYVYNADTGMWENDYYIWNPNTNQTTPKTTQTYSYNPATGHWDTTDWIYDPAQGQYVPNVVSVVTPPAGAATIGGPATNADTSTQGPNSPITDTNNGTGVFDNFYNASISNNLNQNATTGNASVFQNTTAGSALSGNATDMATILNMLQSSTSLQGGNITTFNQDVGDWTGDLVIDPSQLSNLGTISPNNHPSDLTINTQGSGTINNNIDLAAKTGDASVSQNTTAGDATSGDAAAIANIVNVINSVIGAGQSFIGTINIRGNLDGDILLPPDALNTLLAAGSSTSTAGPNSPINSDGSNTFNATLTDNTGINNTMNLSAQSGSADVSNNTTAGNATSGNAGTNLTVLNLTGRQVIGNDALLVFVNVMGKWVGMIVNAPAGASTAALCNCSSTSTAGPNSPINSDDSSNTNLNSSTNNSINNNVHLAATSGNASVTDNTTAGNATSGNALASLNLLNISTSSLSLSNWLGVLFINVFGSWNGSFGIDTAAGNHPSTESAGAASSPAVAEAVNQVKVFSFIPKGSSGSSFSAVPLASATNPTSNHTSGQPTVLSATNNKPKPPQPKNNKLSLLWVSGSLFLLAGIIQTEEAISRRKAQQLKLRKYWDSITVQPFKKD
jgi:hypothetical protein